jgi:type II secretory pathway predicted ATPase ExeA
VARLHQASQGLARKLNNLARDALIAAAATAKDLVDDACAKKAVAEHAAHEGAVALPVGVS